MGGGREDQQLGRHCTYCCVDLTLDSPGGGWGACRWAPGPRTGPRGGAGSHRGLPSRRRGAGGNVGATGPAAHHPRLPPSGNRSANDAQPTVKESCTETPEHKPLRPLMALTHHAGTIILVMTPTAHLKPSLLPSRNDL